MNIIQKDMYVLRRKNTNEYMRNNTYFRDINSDSKSSIRLYDNINLAKSAVRGFEEDYDFVPVKVTIETRKEN